MGRGLVLAFGDANGSRDCGIGLERDIKGKTNLLLCTSNLFNTSRFI